MNFEEYLESSRRKLTSHLQKYFSKRRKDKIPLLLTEQKFIESLEEFAVRGKFLRGSLFLLTVEGMGKKLSSCHYDIACAIELMHSSLLIQDDIIDNDYIRRGLPAVFAKYEKSGEKIGVSDPYHYGISSAIVVSDISFFYSFDLVSNFDDKNLSVLLKKYIFEVYMVILAEGADTLFGQSRKEPTKKEIEDVYIYKTARYTFSLPMEMGVICSGYPNLQEKLRKLGEMIGFIFQIKDDEIGLFGDENKAGKPVGGDIRENKKTLIRHYLYEYSNDKEKTLLNNCFGNKNAGLNEIKIIKKIYEKNIINEKINKVIDMKMEKVWKLYEEISFKKEYKEILRELIIYNLGRTY